MRFLTNRRPRDTSGKIKRSFRWGSRPEERRGASVVEFALVAPIFFMLVLGMIEVGRALMVQQVITNASRVGARKAITLSGTELNTITRVEDYADNTGVPGVTVTVSPDPADTDPGDEITVHVSVDFANVSWMPSPWFLGGMSLQASSVMRKEGF